MNRRFIALVSVFCILAAGTMTVSAAPYPPEQHTVSSGSCQAVFEDISIPYGADMGLICYAGGKIIYSVTHDNGEKTEQHLYYIDDNGYTQTKKHLFKTDMAQNSILSLCGNMYEGMYILLLETDGAEENIFLKSVSWDGKVKDIICLNDLRRGEEDNCRDWKIDASADGTVIIYSKFAYRAVSWAGTILEEGTFQKPDLCDIHFFQDAAVLFTRYDYGAREVSLIDRNGETKLTNLPLQTENYQMLNETENSILIRTDWHLCRFYPSQDKLEFIWNWSDFGIDGEKVRQICLSESGELEAMIDGKNNKLRKVVWKDSQAVSREQIILGCMGESGNVYRAAAQFNADQDDYAVIVKNYAFQNTVPSWEFMSDDIQAGPGPDLIAADAGNMDYSCLLENGILEDLTPYLADSDDIKEKDLVPSVCEAMKTDGNLYVLPTNFSISFLSAQKDNALFAPTSLYEVNDYLYAKHIGGDGFQAAGYPGAGGNGVLIVPHNCWGIYSQSSKKDIAWKFIESFFVSEDLVHYNPGWPFPIVEELFEEQLAEGARKQMYTDMDGTIKEYPRIYYEDKNGVTKIYAAKQEDLQEIRDLVNGAESVYGRYDEIGNIVQKGAESDAYMKAHK